MRRIALCFAVAAALVPQVVQGQGSQYLGFLLNNRLKNSPMPSSYAVQPPDYFENVPSAERDHNYVHPYYQPFCGGNVSAANMNAYEFQTEKWLTTLGTDIYDAGVWSIAVSLLGHASNATAYINSVLVGDQTIQFHDIRGDAPCKGVEYYNQCTNGCGFCYGDNAQSLTKQNAYFFRLISDYWAIQGTVDARCPEQNKLWTWNDYKPVLGENAWAQLLGPAQVAMISNNYDAGSIPDSDPLFTLAGPFLQALTAMKVGETGGFYYTPWNTWFGFTHSSESVGATFSIENQASLLAGLEALEYILKNKPTSSHAGLLPQVSTFVTNLRTFILTAYEPSLGFFRQGGTYNKTTDTISWTQKSQPIFAVDCQTWVSAVLGTKLIDTTYGEGAAYGAWKKVKEYAGYQCEGMLCGVGYTFNNISGPVLSGEWSYGAINWLRVMIADSGYNQTVIGELQNDIQSIQFGLSEYMQMTSFVQNGTTQYTSVKYSNKRYYIPFGWWGNPIPATASTAWAALVESNYNPFNVMKGVYTGYGSSL